MGKQVMEGLPCFRIFLSAVGAEFLLNSMPAVLALGVISE